MNYQFKTFNEKCKIARNATVGSIWINVKTGKKCTIDANTFKGVCLKHESGRYTLKQHHYFASDYYPENQS